MNSIEKNIGNFIFLAVAACYGLANSGCASRGTRPEPKINLCTNFKTDLNYIHDSIKSNFVGYTHSPEIRKNTDAAYLRELDLAKECQSNLDYIKSIKRYFAVFNDPHVKAIWNGTEKYGALIELSAGKKLPKLTFPIHFVSAGVFVSRINGKVFVQGIDPIILPASSLKKGDELKSCYGKKPQDILENEILPFEPVSAKEAALYRFTPHIFLRWDQPSAGTFQCEFVRDGQSFSQTFTWKSVVENYLEKTFQNAPSKIYEIEKTPYGHWVTLKTFAGYSEEINKQLKQFVEDAKTLRKDKVIVVDVRGNGGGNSSWGSAWIDEVFGFHKEPPIKSFFVLASPGNKAHFESLYSHLQKTGGLTSEEAAVFWQKILNTVKVPTGKLEEFHETPSKSETQSKKGFKGLIYVLTDAGVFSSGETFVEQLKLMPRVKQVGIATNASTYYSDIRFDIAPSGLAFNFPTKGFSDPAYKRGSGEALVPEIPLSQDPELELSGRDSMKLLLEKIISESKKK
jgi:hypothetical protein